MLDLYELKQLSAFADLGTLARVAEEFHISTPSVTRSMHHVEEAFAVPEALCIADSRKYGKSRLHFLARA